MNADNKKKSTVKQFQSALNYVCDATRNAQIAEMDLEVVAEHDKVLYDKVVSLKTTAREIENYILDKRNSKTG